MRTNIVIDDHLMDQAINLSGLETKKAVVEQALKLYIQLLQQAALRELRGKLRWEGDLNQGDPVNAQLAALQLVGRNFFIKKAPKIGKKH